MTVTLISHAYGPFYITLLAQQLRSLAGIPNVSATICHWHGESHLIAEAMEGIDADVRWFAIDKPQLLNRGIGRNMVAKESRADWVWFTDVDYLFSAETFQAFAKLDPHKACMYFPRAVQKSTYFYDDSPVFEPSLFVPERQRKAIGGIQIVPGHIASQYGYLDGVEKYHRPAVGDRMYNPREDHIYRKWLVQQTGLPIVAADIPNVYRLRHRIPETSARHDLLPMEDQDGTLTPTANAHAHLPD